MSLGGSVPTGRVAVAVIAAVFGISLGSCADNSPGAPGTVVVNYSTVLAGELPFSWGVSVDGAPAHTVNSSDSGSFAVSDVPAGERRVTLSSLTPGCTSGSDSRIIVVPAGDTARVTFVVKCPVLTAAVRVTVTSTGTPLDPDGYILGVEGGATSRIGLDTTVIRGFVPGTAAVTLADIEPNCVAANRTQSVTAARHDTVSLTFTISCAAYAIGVIGASFTDPVGDTLSNPNGTAPRAFDYTRVTTRYSPGLVTVTLKFAAALPTTVPYLYYIDMDLDESGATGISPSVNLYGGDSEQGVEAYVVHEGLPTPIDTLWTAAGSSLLRQLVGTDSLVVYIPLEKLNDDGNMTLTSLIGTTIIQPGRPMDVVPDSGQIVSHVPAGVSPVRIPSVALAGATANSLLRPGVVRWVRRRR